MQLRLRPSTNKSIISGRLIIKTVLIFITFFVAIFLLDKIDFPKPTKLIEQKISNDKFETLK